MWPSKFNEDKFCNQCGNKMRYLKWMDAQKKGWEPLCTPCTARSHQAFIAPTSGK